MAFIINPKGPFYNSFDGQRIYSELMQLPHKDIKIPIEPLRLPGRIASFSYTALSD